jgi:hypothetical protein
MTTRSLRLFMDSRSVAANRGMSANGRHLCNAKHGVFREVNELWIGWMHLHLPRFTKCRRNYKPREEGAEAWAQDSSVYVADIRPTCTASNRAHPQKRGTPSPDGENAVSHAGANIAPCR